MEELPYNFNNPLELTEIFKYQDEDEDKRIEKVEYAHKTSILWEDIRGIKQYAYVDGWIKYKGPKYWIDLKDKPDLILILGDYEELKRYWRIFRNRYPIFIDEA